MSMTCDRLISISISNLGTLHSFENLTMGLDSVSQTCIQYIRLKKDAIQTYEKFSWIIISVCIYFLTSFEWYMSKRWNFVRG